MTSTVTHIWWTQVDWALVKGLPRSREPGLLPFQIGLLSPLTTPALQLLFVLEWSLRKRENIKPRDLAGPSGDIQLYLGIGFGH